MATYVLVPGGWSGGWVWKAIGKVMQTAGHEVYRVTLTGLGERVHLASPEIGLETHFQDVINVFEYEQLTDVILVGTSYSGLVITGVAERIPQRIKELIYFDAFVPQDGESMADLLGPAVTQAMEEAAKQYGDGWRVPHDPPDAERRTPMPLNGMYYKFALRNAQAAALPRTFIECTVWKPDDFVLASVHAAARRAQDDPKWRYLQIAAEHGNFWETHVQVTADLLMSLA